MTSSPTAGRSCLLWLLAIGLLCSSSIGANAATSPWEQALEHYRQGELALAAAAFSDIASSTDDPELRGRALNNACGIRNDLGDFAGSRPLCQQAVESHRVHAHTRVSRALNNLAVALQGLGDSAAAVAALNDALALNRKAPDWDGIAANLTNLAINHQLLGHYASAEASFQEAADACRARLDQAWAADRLALAELNRASLLERLGRYAEALAVLEALLSADANGPGLSKPFLATAELNRGVIYRNLGDPYLALSSFARAGQLYQDMGNQGGRASALLNSALANSLGLGKHRSALVDLTQALEIAQREQEASLQSEILITRGRVQLALGELELARIDFDQALERASKSGLDVALWSAQYGLATVERSVGNFDAAQAHILAALGTIHNQSAGLDRGTESSYLTSQRALYEAAIAITLDNARTLNREHPALRPVEDDSAAGDTYRLVQEYKRRALTNSLRGATPNETSAPDLSSVLTALQDAELIEFFSVEDRMYAWHLDPLRARIQLTHLGPASAIDDAAERVADAVVNRAFPDQKDLLFLGQTLILDPLGRRARSLPKQLLISRDTSLSRLPFDILLVELETAQEAMLIETTSVQEIPSGSSLVELSNRSRPDYDGDFSGWALTDAENWTHGLPPLPNAPTEISVAAKAIGGQTRQRVGESASEVALRTAETPARIRHFATHTRIDDRAGLATTIVLAAVGPIAADASDGLLSPADISELSLPAELTILAACTTSGDPKPDGGGALGTLAGAFIVAGSQAVLATLWDIDDTSSLAFLEQFTFRLGQGQPAAAALRDSKLAMVADRRWSDPLYWAGWVLIGDSPRLPTRSNRSRFWLAIALTAGALALSLRFISSKRR